MKNSQLAIEPRNYPTELPAELEDAIRRRAYEIYEQRQGMNGSAEDDWLQAEAEILNPNVKGRAA